jgi:diguanylate cyclase (GGDEF)-like protein
LTGLANRRQFEQNLQNEMARSQRYGGALSLAMIDVDYFKNYNDVCGHLAEDAVLREIAEIIRTNLRIGDFAGRYGGEELCPILPRIKG